jgi:dUTPase
MVKVELKTDEGVFAPLYMNANSSKVDLMAKSFKKLFKGTKEVMLDKKLQKSINEGYITLRGFERILIGTGLHPTVPQGFAFQIISKNGLAFKKGLALAGGVDYIDSNHKGEIGVVISNNTPFLNRIQLGDIVAQAVLVKIQHALWIDPIELKTEFKDTLEDFEPEVK